MFYFMLCIRDDPYKSKILFLGYYNTYSGNHRQLNMGTLRLAAFLVVLASVHSNTLIGRELMGKYQDFWVNMCVRDYVPFCIVQMYVSFLFPLLLYSAWPVQGYTVRVWNNRSICLQNYTSSDYSRTTTPTPAWRCAYNGNHKIWRRVLGIRFRNL